MKLKALNTAMALAVSASALTLAGCAGDDDDSSSLVRLATAPVGAEFTGMFLTDNNFFFNTQHPDNQDASIWVARADMANAGTISHLSLPQTDEEKETTRISYGEISRLGFEGNNGLGVIKTAAGDATLTISNDPDFNAFIPKTPGDDTSGYLFTNWENRPGGMSRMEVSYADGTWTSTNETMLDFSSVKGTWVNCFGTLSPWNTPLSSEELYFDDTAEWHGSDTIADLDTYLGANESPNPYRYGYIVEITDPAVTATPEKRFAMGRFSHENAVVMPDQKTAYLSDDGTDVIFYKFIADTAGDLSSGTLYAAQVTQDAGVTDSAEAGFDINWIELASGNDTDIEAKIATFDGTTNYVTDAEIAAAATDADASNDWIAFVESRKFAAAKGASAEFRKMEGVNINHDRVVSQHAAGGDAFMYMAMSSIEKGMSDTAGDIQVSENKCGIVYQMKLDPTTYNVDRMEPVVIGGPYDANATTNQCHIDSISNPDNLVIMDDGRVIIGEDTSKHENNMMWVWNPADGKFVIKAAE